jgi:hypothetical protein
MPTDTPGVELDQYQKDKDEFAEAMDDVFSADEGKTDDEINADMDKKKADSDQDVDGISKKDSDKDASTSKDADDSSDLLSPGQGVATEDDSKPATDKETDGLSDIEKDWKKKAEDVEAELTKEKQKTSSWNGRITAANKKVKDLEAELKQKAPSADDIAAKQKADAANESDNEVLDRFQNDFPELADVISILKKRVDGVAQAPVKDNTPVSSDDDVTDDSDAEAAKAAAGDHMSDIRKVHPDLSEMVNTGVLLTWIHKQPDFIRPTLETIYSKGKSQEVVNMVTEFKNKTGWKSQLAQADNETQKADDKLNSMKEVNSETTTPDGKTVDKGDYDQGAKDAGL